MAVNATTMLVFISIDLFYDQHMKRLHISPDILLGYLLPLHACPQGLLAGALSSLTWKTESCEMEIEN